MYTMKAGSDSGACFLHLSCCLDSTARLSPALRPRPSLLLGATGEPTLTVAYRDTYVTTDGLGRRRDGGPAGSGTVMGYVVSRMSNAVSLTVDIAGSSVAIEKFEEYRTKESW